MICIVFIFSKITNLLCIYGMLDQWDFLEFHVYHHLLNIQRDVPRRNSYCFFFFFLIIGISKKKSIYNIINFDDIIIPKKKLTKRD
jgi:hypothetical protein